MNNELIAAYGNFANRILTFVNRRFDGSLKGFNPKLDPEVVKHVESAYEKVSEKVEEISFQDALKELMKLPRFSNKYIDDQKPWESIKSDKDKCAEAMFNGLYILNNLRILTYPFLPFSSARLSKQLGVGEVSPKESLDQWKPVEWDPDRVISKEISPLIL